MLLDDHCAFYGILVMYISVILLKFIIANITKLYNREKVDMLAPAPFDSHFMAFFVFNSCNFIQWNIALFMASAPIFNPK